MEWIETGLLVASGTMQGEDEGRWLVGPIPGRDIEQRVTVLIDIERMQPRHDLAM
jgi:hypothetical protein